MTVSEKKLFSSKVGRSDREGTSRTALILSPSANNLVFVSWVLGPNPEVCFWTVGLSFCWASTLFVLVTLLVVGTDTTNVDYFSVFSDWELCLWKHWGANWAGEKLDSLVLPNLDWAEYLIWINMYDWAEYQNFEYATPKFWARRISRVTLEPCFTRTPILTRSDPPGVVIRLWVRREQLLLLWQRLLFYLIIVWSFMKYNIMHKFSTSLLFHDDQTMSCCRWLGSTGFLYCVI